MNRFAISIIAPAILAWSLSPAEAAGTIAFGVNSASCGRAAMCSSDGTHGYLTNGKGQAFKASTIGKWFQVAVDGKSHLKGQGAEPLRGSGSFVVVNDTGRPISKFALRIQTDGKACANATPCNAFAAKGGNGTFGYDSMLTARDRHKCTQGKTVRDICVGDTVRATFASNKVLYSWTAKPQGAIPNGAYFLITFSGWTNDAWTASPTPPTIEMLSRATDSTPGDGDSVASGQQYVTPDGNQAVFSTSATNLPGSSTSNETIYMYDRTSGALTPIPTEIPNSYSNNTLSSISADASFAMFYTNDGWPKFYIYDVGLGTIQTVSWSSIVSYAGKAMLSRDNAYVLYQGSGAESDGYILVYNRATGATSEMLSPDGSLPDNEGCSALATTGQFNVVGCTSDNIIPGTSQTLYLWDQFANTFENIERSTDGNQSVPAGYSDASISSDARFIGFDSHAQDLVPGGTTGDQVFVFDNQTGLTQLGSAAADGTQGNETNDQQGQGNVSSDGRYVAFFSNATNLVSGVNNTGTTNQLYVKDLTTGEIQQVTLATDGAPADCTSWNPTIDTSGQYVYFESCASNLSPNGNAGHWQVYLATLQ